MLTLLRNRTNMCIYHLIGYYSMRTNLALLLRSVRFLLESGIVLRHRLERGVGSGEGATVHPRACLALLDGLDCTIMHVQTSENSPHANKRAT